MLLTPVWVNSQVWSSIVQAKHENLKSEVSNYRKLARDGWDSCKLLIYLFFSFRAPPTLLRALVALKVRFATIWARVMEVRAHTTGRNCRWGSRRWFFIAPPSENEVSVREKRAKSRYNSSTLIFDISHRKRYMLEVRAVYVFCGGWASWRCLWKKVVVKVQCVQWLIKYFAFIFHCWWKVIFLFGVSLLS